MLWINRCVLESVAALGLILHPGVVHAQLEHTSKHSIETAAKPAATERENNDRTMSARLVQSYGELPLSFEANQGQVDSRVKFLSHGAGYELLLTANEAILVLPHTGAGGQRRARIYTPGMRPSNGNRDQSGTDGTAQSGASTTLRMKLLGANTSASVSALDELPGKTNYFTGNDPKQWHTNVPNYAKVKYHDVYPGVDLMYYGNRGGELEYDFVVAPGANPDAISFSIGADPDTAPNKHGSRASLDRVQGDIVLHVRERNIRLHKPVVYQEDRVGNKHYIGGRYLLNDELEAGGQSIISLRVEEYDHSKPLVIDPAIVYSTYLGGSNGNSEGNGVAVFTDPATNHVYAYVAGGTCASDFPTVNAHQANNNGGVCYVNVGDVFVTKFDPAASGSASVIYSTYLGGNGSDGASAISVDSTGNAYVTGITTSTDFPVANAYQPTYKFQLCSTCAQHNAFLSKLSSDGSTLMYST